MTMDTMYKIEEQNQKREKFEQNIWPWDLVLSGEAINEQARPLKIDKSNPLHIILNPHHDQVMLTFALRAGLDIELQVHAHECSIKEIIKAFFLHKATYEYSI
jgi:hypothetical protein